jgi:hypothetical protein
MKVSIIAVLTAAMLGGCIVPGGFSPVRGPLSKQSPIPTYAATMSGLFSGTISVALDSGEVCKGPWALVSNTVPGTSTTTPIDMVADWDSVYGTGYFAAHVLGNKLYARATVTGNMGTVLHAEFSNENNAPGNTKGVAEDNNGNVFKVSVYN